MWLWEARVEFLRLLLRYLHLVGFALLVGAWLAQYVTGTLRVNVLVRTGLGTMIGTGLLLAIPFRPPAVPGDRRPRPRQCRDRGLLALNGDPTPRWRAASVHDQ